jgi:hypothetical protein
MSTRIEPLVNESRLVDAPFAAYVALTCIIGVLAAIALSDESIFTPVAIKRWLLYVVLVGILIDVRNIPFFQRLMGSVASPTVMAFTWVSVIFLFEKPIKISAKEILDLKTYGPFILEIWLISVVMVLICSYARLAIWEIFTNVSSPPFAEHLNRFDNVFKVIVSIVLAVFMLK